MTFRESTVRRRVPDGHRRGDAERRRAKLAAGGGGLEGIEVEAGHGRQRLGLVERDPALEIGPAHVLVRRHQVELLARHPLHHRPGVAGRTGLVHDEDRRGVMALALLVLVGPPTVIRHRLAAENGAVESGGPRRIRHRWIIHQHDERLTGDIHPLEVVPPILGRLDAVAHEHDVGVGDRGPVGHVLREGRDVLLVVEYPTLAVTLEHEGAFHRRGDADQRHLLHVAAVGVSGSQPHPLELALQVGDGAVFARRSRTPAEKGIGGEGRDRGE